MTTATWKPKSKDLVNLSFAPEYHVNQGKEMVQALELEIAKAQYRETFPPQEQATLQDAATSYEKVETFEQVKIKLYFIGSF